MHEMTCMRSHSSSQSHLSHHMMVYDACLHRIQKQLHPGWVASRQARPEMCAMWNAEEQQRGVCNTRGIDLYRRPLPAEVAAASLAFL